MFATPETQLFKNQYDNLYEETANNPYLKASSRPSKNKALKTEDKKIIGAINEVKATADAAAASVGAYQTFNNNIVGDHKKNATLHQEFLDTGYSNLTEGIIKLHEKTATDAKNIVFVFPKVNASTIFPELYIPFDMHLESVTVRFSVEDNPEMETFTDNIKVVLQHTSNDNPTEFTTFKEVVMENTNQNSFISVNFTEDDEIRDLPAGIMKARITEFPDNIKNVNIVVSATKANI